MPQQPTTRRQFFQGQSAVEALTAWAGPADTLGAGLELPPSANYLLQFGRRAMACEFQVMLNAGEQAAGAEAAVAALDLVDQLENQLSVYRPHSEVSRVNALAAHQAVTVEPRLFALLEQAVRLHCQTDGAFDITAGPLARCWGFYRREGRVPDATQLRAAMACIGSQHLVLDASAVSVRFACSGMEINLGSIGKGYALDRCRELLVQQGIGSFLLHGGQSSVLAQGSHAAETAGADRLTEAPNAAADDRGGWWVGLRHPLRPERRLARIRLQDRALGTSGSGAQFFYHEGRRLGHILDPRTGHPAEGVLSATVVAPTAAEADALATACFVLGPQQAIEYCRNHASLAAILVSPGARAGTIAVAHTGFNETNLRFDSDP